MHNFVQRMLRGVIFCSVCIGITACAGFTDLADSETTPKSSAIATDEGLPRIDVIRLRVANNAMANGDFNTAIRFFESVRKSSPTHAAPLIGIAKAHLAAGSHKEAIQAYREVLELHPDNDEALDEIGRALVLTGNYGEAIEFFNRSVAKAPTAALYNRLGVAHDLLGDGEGAQKHYRAALDLDPEAISPRNNLALSLAISESYEEAIKHMERVAAHPQATDKHRQNLTFVYGMAGENDEALAGLSENGLTASEIAKNRALYQRIRTHARAGNHAKILEFLRNGTEFGDTALADEMAGPSDPSTAMVSATPDQDGKPAPKVRVIPPKSLMKRAVLPKGASQETTRLAKINNPAKIAPRKPTPAMMRDVGGYIYRVQLAAYRTSRTAVRGVNILKSILRENTPDLDILVRNIRSKKKRAIDYRLRTPELPNRETADMLCAKIITAGHPDCLVILHNPRIWAGVDSPKSSLVANSSPVTFSPSGAEQRSYRVQLASFRTERGATKGQAILKKLLGDRDVSLDIMARHGNTGGPGAFLYQIRTGPIKTRAEGTELCEALKQAGHQGCLVIRHNDVLWKNLAQPSERQAASMESQQEEAQQGDAAMQPDNSMSEDALPDDRQAAVPTALMPKAEMPASEGTLPTYRVQLASFRTASSALKGKVKLKNLLGDRAVSLDIMVKRARSDGLDYQIRTGPLKSLTEGAKLCEVLKNVGHQECAVVQHNDLLWRSLAIVSVNMSTAE
ncbi:MAG: tetratricopeptide repeat protein [Proteobacteria bacterium]|nr:tetratricopeptide repeat protein [Pseudomonadota bacterium]